MEGNIEVKDEGVPWFMHMENMKKRIRFGDILMDKRKGGHLVHAFHWPEIRHKTHHHSQIDIHLD